MQLFFPRWRLIQQISARAIQKVTTNPSKMPFISAYRKISPRYWQHVTSCLTHCFQKLEAENLRIMTCGTPWYRGNPTTSRPPCTWYSGIGVRSTSLSGFNSRPKIGVANVAKLWTIHNTVQWIYNDLKPSKTPKQMLKLNISQTTEFPNFDQIYKLSNLLACSELLSN